MANKADTQAELRAMDVQIISIEFDIEIEGQSGTYPGCEVIYKDAGGETRTKGMHNNTFKYNKVLRTQLGELNPRDFAHVVTEKKGSFVNWVSAEKIEAPAQEKHGEAKEEKKEYTVRNTYETPEERAVRRELDNKKFEFDRKKQVLIIRQSSLTAALTLASLAQETGSGYIPTEQDIIASAEVFTKWVLGNDTNQTSKDDDEPKLPD